MLTKPYLIQRAKIMTPLAAPDTRLSKADSLRLHGVERVRMGSPSQVLPPDQVERHLLCAEYLHYEDAAKALRNWIATKRARKALH